jgi:hypothetical protein
VTYSALMVGRELLVIVWKARMFCHIDLSQPLLLEDVPLAVRARMWYMHDGAPAHFSRAVRYVLSNTHHDHGQVEEDSLHGLHAHLT